MDMGAVKAVHTGNLIRVIALGETLEGSHPTTESGNHSRELGRQRTIAAVRPHAGANVNIYLIVVRPISNGDCS